VSAGEDLVLVFAGIQRIRLPHSSLAMGEQMVRAAAAAGGIADAMPGSRDPAVGALTACFCVGRSVSA